MLFTYANWSGIKEQTQQLISGLTRIIKKSRLFMGVRFESLTEAYRVKKWRGMNHGQKKHFQPLSMASRCVGMNYTFSSGHIQSSNRHLFSQSARFDREQQAMERLCYSGKLAWCSDLRCSGRSSWTEEKHLALEAGLTVGAARVATRLPVSDISGWT